VALGGSVGPQAALAASRSADLKVQLEGYDQSKHEAQLKVTNTGDDTASATTLQVQTLAPGANSGKPTSVNVPTLKGSQTFKYAYKLEQSCAPGLRVKAQDTLAATRHRTITRSSLIRVSRTSSSRFRVANPIRTSSSV
jgi:hypothetical protein